MDKMLSIQAFSTRTGIPKSTLRFYEKKKLLMSALRDENGYRFYHKEQIPLAKLISSLRLAQISIQEIQSFLTLGKQERNDKMTEWKTELKKKQQLIGASLNYLESYQNSTEVYFLEKPACKVVWFEAEASAGMFKSIFHEKLKLLLQEKIEVGEAYLQYISGVDQIKARVGFGLQGDIHREKINWLGKVETMPAMVCIGMPFYQSISSIKEGYSKLFQYAQEHHWLPASGILEWYRGENLDDLDLIMPIIKEDF